MYPAPLLRFARRLLLFAGPVAALFAADPVPPSTASAAPRPAWFREARFGLFIHWGVYAVPAGEWQGKPVKGIGEWIMKNGAIPVADYRDFAGQFTAAKYDPVAWARLAKRAGMRYVVITAKHHDGFALYDSAVTSWDVAASAAQRDLLTPLAAAVRAEGLKFGTYYSQAQDWNHPGGAIAGGKGPWDPAQKGDYDVYLREIALPQVREILARFSPDILWWDTPTDMTPERARPFAELLAQHPNIITNNRLGGGYNGDTKTPEQHIPPRGYPGEMFEVCMTMNDTWGFKRDDHNWKSVRQLLENLTDIASKGGNFLLNVGPTAAGEIPPESIERLEAIGRWMQVNSQSIYDTEASPFPRRLPWGRVTQRHSAGGATTLYLHIWEWPADGKLLLPTVTQRPQGGSLLADGTAVTAEITPAGLVVHLPGNARDASISVARLEFAAPVVVTQEPYNLPDATGRITFPAQDADVHGAADGHPELVRNGDDSYLTKWTGARWRAEYTVKSATAARWRVVAEIAAAEPTKLLLVVGKKEQPLEVPATGGPLAWETRTLGEIDLPAGAAAFDVRGAKDGFKPISLRRVWVEPIR
jgi:alpha-L-fucosidase